MNIILWILSVFLSFTALLLLRDVASGKSILAFVLALLAIALVFPPLQPLIKQKISGLKSNGLRIFLAIILFFACVMSINPGKLYAFESMIVCGKSSSQGCETPITQFIENTPKISVVAISETPIDDVEMTVIDKSNPGNIEVFSKTYASKDVLKGEQDYVVEFDSSKLDVGLYNIQLKPGEVEDGRTRVSRQKITIWPTKEDVTRRLAGGELAETSSSRELSDLVVCSFTSKEAKDEEQQRCPGSKAELSSNEEVLAFEAELDGSDEEPVKLTYTFRKKKKSEKVDQYEVLVRKTLDIEPKIDFMTYMLGLPKDGLEPGAYDIIVAMETQDATPLRKTFTLKG